MVYRRNGDRVQALTAYFAHQHFIPVDRVCQIFEDVFGFAISPGTCFNVDEKLFRQLESFESSLKTHLTQNDWLSRNANHFA
jgi:transposase